MGTTIGIGIRIGSGVSIGPPAVINDGNTVAWFDAQENITKDGSDLVSVWGDKTGLAHHLLQATGTNQPLWSANGVLFDGIDNFMKCVAFEWNQPEFIYMVARQVTWTGGDSLFDGNGVGGGMFQQTVLSPAVRLYAGSYSTSNSNWTLNTFMILRLLFNGLNSSIQVNNTPAIVSDAGGNNMAGSTLGARADAGNPGNLEVKEIIGRTSALGEAEIYAYLAAKYSI